MLTISEKLAVTILTKIASDPQIIGRLLESIGSMPNIPTKTMGGYVFWKDIANVNGWRLQRNQVFGNYRILDPNNIRRAWGGESAMLQFFQSIQ
jgi:hypothetical protein